MGQRAIVAMSGGVDSSVAAALMVEAGYDVIGVTLNVEPREIALENVGREDACCSITSVEDARRVADHLGIPHYSLNFRDLFRTAVIDDFAAEYARGRTPNPCVRCNERIKFTAVFDRLIAMDADVIATGHYARRDRCAVTGRARLRRARDLWKDQSYVLYPIPRDLLERVTFPLGEMSKDEVRQEAGRRGLVTASKAESQEICFVPNGDYASFLQTHYGLAARPGPIRDRGGRLLGEHRGIIYYTVGQRRGLGLAEREPWYVIRIVAERNEIIVGTVDDLCATSFVVADVNWVSVEPPLTALDVATRIRSRSAPAASMIVPEVDGRIMVHFHAPQRAVTPGQAAVFYQGDVVIGGGTIETVIGTNSAPIASNPVSLVAPNGSIAGR